MALHDERSANPEGGQQSMKLAGLRRPREWSNARRTRLAHPVAGAVVRANTRSLGQGWKDRLSERVDPRRRVARFEDYGRAPGALALVCERVAADVGAPAGCSNRRGVAR